MCLAARPWMPRLLLGLFLAGAVWKCGAEVARLCADVLGAVYLLLAIATQRVLPYPSHAVCSTQIRQFLH